MPGETSIIINPKHIKSRALILVLLHLAFGYAISFSPSLTFYWGIGILMIGTIDTITKGNKDNRAAKWAAYYMGAEVLLRMTSGYVFWEAGKYGVTLLLLTGMLSEPFKRPAPRLYFIYFFLLLPSLLIVDFPDMETAREEISFNLSGPLVLATSAFYFYRRNITGTELLKILRCIVLPLTVMLVYLILVTPNINEIDYGTESNYKAAGGFGPNQVSTAIGIAIFVFAIGRFYKFSIAGFLGFDILLLAFFIIRGLATFSRGGVIGSLIGISVLVVYTAIVSKQARVIYATLSFVLFASLAGLYIWNYVNEQTGGRLEYRYKGVNFRTGTAKDISSGRTDIMLNELNHFVENPLLGIGPGMGALLVQNKAGLAAHSHSEYTRLLAEHGMLGLISLLILIFTPLREIFRKRVSARPLLLAIFVFMLFTLFHSAMRLALPGFIYGLTLINVQTASSKVKNKQLHEGTDDHNRMAYSRAAV